MKLIQYTLSALFIALMTLPLAAQENFTGDNFCGYEGKSQWLQDYQDGKFPEVVRSKSMDIQYLPLQVHMLADDNGLNYMSPLRFVDAFNTLNEDFLDQNIQFFVEGDINYVNATRFNDHNGNTGDEMLRTLSVNGRVNTFIVENPNGNCGYYSGGRDGVVLGRNCLGAMDRTWSHEMGHYFSLPHTFYGFESLREISALDFNEPAPTTVSYRGRNVPVEKVDGSNCADAADGFCDTAPDYLMQRWGCNNSGFYPDSLTDPDTVRFAIPAFNIMSYSSDNCVESFTNDQKDAMFANLNSIVTNRPISNTPPNLLAADEANLVMYTPADRERLDFIDSVTMSWSAVPNAAYYIVQYNTSANFGGSVIYTKSTRDTSLTILEGLSRRETYYWRVRPVAQYNTAGDFGPTFRFTNGTLSGTNDIDAALNGAITIAPNPVSGGQLLQIDGREIGMNGQMDYQLINAAGQVMVNRQGLQVSSFGFSERIETGNLPAGIYFLRLRIEDKLVSRRIVVTP